MKIAIGSANLGTKYGLFGKKKLEIKELQKIEKLLSKSKIEFIDTANQYKSSEEIIGKSKLKNRNIITKIKLPKQSTLSINKIVNKIIFKSLKRLNKKTIHSILVHDYRDLLGNRGKEFLKELKMLKQNGFVKNIGISIYVNIPHTQKCLACLRRGKFFPVVALFPHYWVTNPTGFPGSPGLPVARIYGARKFRATHQSKNNCKKGLTYIWFMSYIQGMM